MKKTNLSIFLLIILAVSLTSFKDVYVAKYTMVNDVVIKRNDGALYQKGVINIKFKEDVNIPPGKLTGIFSIDALLSDENVKQIVQPYPLKQDISKRVFGDEQIARIYVIKYDSNTDPSELASLIFEKNKNILDWAEPEYVMEADFIPNDPSLASQWHIQKIQSYNAWDITQGDTNVVIGIVDSGSDLDHPDLAANIKYNYAENPTNGIDDDLNGYIDDWRGWDFAGANYLALSEDNDPNIYTSYCEHGSHVSGCAAEVTNNGIGGAGIGFKSKLLISKHGADNDNTGGGYSYVYNTNNGIVYCYQNGAKVINCSFGSSTYSAYTQLLVNNAWAAGVVICASAGNQGSNAPRYPASYDNVVSVAATNSSDLKSWFSNYHSTVDVCAPGESIYSTLFNNTYVSYDGTSMAAPITSGTVALIRAKFPANTPSQVVQKLLQGCDSIYNLNPSYVGLLGAGRINAWKSLRSDTLLAEFSANPTTVSPGGSVNFTDLSTGGPTSWQWQFPGGNPQNSTLQNPSNIVYGVLGSYDVTLTVFKNAQQHSLTKTNYITVSPASTYRLNESFENMTFPPTGWTKINPLGGSSTGWYRVAAGTTPIPGFTGGVVTAPQGGGSGVAFCNYQSGSPNGGSSGSCDQWLITPQLTNIQPTDSLTFWLNKVFGYAENFQVKISTTTATVAAMTTTVMNQNFTAADSGWVQYKFRIGNLVPAGSNIYIGFREFVNDVVNDGSAFLLDIVRVTSPSVGITFNSDEIPRKYELSQNYPNPFNPVTNINFALPKSSNVRLIVYDIKGQEVAVLLDEFKKAGSYTYNFNAGNISSGVYFYKIIAGDFISTKKMIVLK